MLSRRTSIIESTSVSICLFIRFQHIPLQLSSMYFSGNRELHFHSGSPGYVIVLTPSTHHVPVRTPKKEIAPLGVIQFGALEGNQSSEGIGTGLFSPIYFLKMFPQFIGKYRSVFGKKTFPRRLFPERMLVRDSEKMRNWMEEQKSLVGHGSRQCKVRSTQTCTYRFDSLFIPIPHPPAFSIMQNLFEVLHALTDQYEVRLHGRL